MTRVAMTTCSSCAREVCLVGITMCTAEEPPYQIQCACAVLCRMLRSVLHPEKGLPTMLPGTMLQTLKSSHSIKNASSQTRRDLLTTDTIYSYLLIGGHDVGDLGESPSKRDSVILDTRC